MAFIANMRAKMVQTEQGNKTTKAALERRLRAGEKIHRRELTEPPTKHAELANHPLGKLFEEAEQAHLQEHEKMRS